MARSTDRYYIFSTVRFSTVMVEVAKSDEADESAAGVKTDAKRRRMIAAALAVFTAKGYVGASTDELAAAAGVSKQTLYKAFGHKEGIFAAMISDAADGIYDPFEPLVDRMRSLETAEEAVGLLAAQFTRSIMAPQVQQLRRLVIAEAVRFPELGMLFWEKGFVRMSGSVAQCLEVLNGRGLLDVPDAAMAAQHFAGMLLWIPSNRIMFAGSGAPISQAELDQLTRAGADAFGRAYRRR